MKKSDLKKQIRETILKEGGWGRDDISLEDLIEDIKSEMEDVDESLENGGVLLIQINLNDSGEYKNYNITYRIS